MLIQAYVPLIEVVCWIASTEYATNLVMVVKAFIWFNCITSTGTLTPTEYADLEKVL